MCGGENGDATAVANRGYHCTVCDAWPNSTWWKRAEYRRDVEVGETFDRFRVIARVGDDAMAVHFDAADAERRIALRVYRPWLASDTEFVALFRRTIELHGQLRHPDVIPLEVAGHVDGQLFVATEPVAARSLGALLGQRITWQSAMNLVRRLAEVMQVAHGAGLVAGVVPDDVFVATRQPAPADDPYRNANIVTAELVAIHLFALVLSRTVRADSSGFIARHIQYMSPEQLLGRHLDACSDIYSLGVLAYELVTGQRPFPEPRDPAALIAAQLKQVPVPPSNLAPDLPPAVDAAVMRCLAKDRKQRFASVTALVDALPR
jgi:serine/threonine-protein kinase